MPTLELNAELTDQISIAILAIATLSVLIATTTPSLKKFLGYGKLSPPKSKATILDKLASITVPKTLFVHFYFVLVLWELVKVRNSNNLYLRDVILIIQGLRRIYEQKMVFAPSKAEMHISHYLIGIVFYIIQAMYTDEGAKFTLLPMVLSLMYAQNMFHKRLAKTVKYKVPFASVACPHYGAEIGIYFLLWAISGYKFNVAFMSFVWVCVSLGVSGWQTKQFYKVRYSVIKYVF